MDNDDALLSEMDRMSCDLAIACDWCRLKHPNAPPYPLLAVAYLRDDGEILLLVGALSAVPDYDLPAIRADAQWALETLGYVARPYLVWEKRRGVTVFPGGGSAHARAAGLSRLLKGSLAEHRSEHPRRCRRISGRIHPPRTITGVGHDAIDRFQGDHRQSFLCGPHGEAAQKRMPGDD